MLKRPSSKAAASEELRRTLRYVEPLSNARTPLAGFFNILLELPQRKHEDPAGHIRDKTGTEDRDLRSVR